MTLFGGAQQSGGSLADTWEWDGTNWVQAASSFVPAARYGHGMAYDSTRGYIVMCGGRRD